MKKISFFLIILIGISASSFAQTTSSRKFSWGYKIGLNGSNIRIENGENSDWKTGLVTGLFLNFKTSDKMSLQPELLYSSMGGRQVFEPNSSSLRLNYFSIPLLVKYRASNKLSIVGGPQIDMLIQAKSKNSNSQFAKLTDDFNESSFNLTAGAEYMPWKCLGFTLRYIYGLSNIAEDGAMEMKNQGVQLTTAIKF
ncbi:MAG TPA: porin family protein [Flavisolibacter sp.]